MTLQDAIESERTSLQDLRAIGNRHPHDAETQRHLNSVLQATAERIILLTELWHYRDPSEAPANDA